MSLILEALRKLEREKQTPERGLVVTGASTWARAEERRGLKLALIVVAGLALGAGVWLWRGRGVQAPTTAAGVATDGAASGGATPVARPPDSATPAAAAQQEPADLRLAPRAPARTPASAGPAGVAPDSRPAAGAAGDAAATRSSGATDDRAPAGTDAPARGTRPPAASQPTGVAIAEPATESDARTHPDDASASAEPVRPRTGAGSDRARERTAAAARPAATPEVTLQAVTERDGRPLAIVNGHLVREGDSFDGIRILHIRASEIEVEINGQRRTVGF